MKFRYGNKHAAFPIEAGETWVANCGSTIAVVDITKAFPSWMRADMVYVDPPWNQGNVNAFLTKAEAGYYIGSFAGFVATLFDRIDAMEPTVCYVESGRQNLTLFADAMEARFGHVDVWPITYYKKHPCFLIRGGHDVPRFDFTGMDDSETPAIAVKHEDPERVADPCAGRGLTAIAAHWHGKIFKGTELNKWRLAVLIDRAAKMGVRYAPCPVP